MTTTNNNRLAVLAGLEEENQPLNIEIRTESRETTAPMSESLFQEEEIGSGGGIDRWSFGDKKRLPRIFLFAVVFGILGFAGMFLYSLRGTTVKPAPGEEVKTEPKTDGGSDPELARTKARLGLQTQQQLLNRPAPAGVPNGGSGEIAPRRRESAPLAPVRTRTVAETSPPLVPTAPRVGREPSYRTVRPDRRRREDYSLTSTRPLPPPARVYPSPASVVREEQAIDPEKAWIEASRVGSFGDTGDNLTRPSRTRPVSTNPTEATPTVPVLEENLEVETPWEETYAEESAVLEDRVVRRVKVPAGTRVRGVLETAIVTGVQMEESEVYPIRLTGDVTDRDGRVLMPENSIVFVSVKGARGGAVQLQTDSVLLAKVTDAPDEPISLPPTAFAIRRIDGSPLIARALRSGEGGGGTDVGGLLFDVFSTAAGMLTGGDDAYRNLYQMERVRDIYERNFGGNSDRTIPLVSPGGTGWELEAGTEVSLYVTKGFTIALESPASDNGEVAPEEIETGDGGPW
jgi:hypothetical protein